MELKKIDYNFSVCRVNDYSKTDFDSEYCFIGKTDEERSVVCVTTDIPCNVVEREDGWKAFRIEGTNTDYILTKSDNYDRAIEVLEQAGYQFI